MKRWAEKAVLLGIAVVMMLSALHIAPMNMVAFDVLWLGSAVPTWLAFKTTRRR
ncbi:MAG: hypothetical protein KGI38_09160 [Thaumarchaeota archaeon]|nr:hypothetical protein [Nitrososphaerota archaeon]